LARFAVALSDNGVALHRIAYLLAKAWSSSPTTEKVDEQDRR
jgi:hypothetical protein